MNVQSDVGAMGRVAVTDWSLWIKHISGDRHLAAVLEGLSQGDMIELVIDGEIGLWEKKADGTDGRPTPGLKPIGNMKELWFEWFRSRRGALVEICLPAGSRQNAERLSGVNRTVRADAPSNDADAAWAAFAALRLAGWQFTPEKVFSRDQLHERNGS